MLYFYYDLIFEVCMLGLYDLILNNQRLVKNNICLIFRKLNDFDLKKSFDILFIGFRCKLLYIKRLFQRQMNLIRYKEILKIVSFYFDFDIFILGGKNNL